jgi:type VI secretion system protein ImpG
MSRAFLEAYNRELGLLYERSREFAEEYPGIAERLGGLTQGNLDPAVAGLLEGAAFLAARVQLQLGAEFKIFTSELLEQLLPNFMAPTPSTMLVEAQPKFDNPDLVNGQHFPAGAYLDARYMDREQRIACRFRLSSPLTLWPLRLGSARLLQGAGGFQALGLEVNQGTAGGLLLSFERPGVTDPKKADGPVSELALDRLPIHLVGEPSDMIAMYEQVFCNTHRITLRWLDVRGDPVFRTIPLGSLQPLGFDPDESLFPEDTRAFHGFALLREFFVFQQKFLGFRLSGLSDALTGIDASAFDLLIEMNSLRPGLPARIRTENFRLYSAPAINLFEENCSQVKLDARRHEYLVTPDSSPASHYEVHRIREVFAYYSGTQAKVSVHPLYGLPADLVQPRQALYYTYRRRPRRLTEKERRFGKSQGYAGTETLISIYEPATLDSDDRGRRLQVRLLCSNRHLPQYLPLSQGDTDFRLNDDVTIGLRCIAGPTPPRPAVMDMEAAESHRSVSGPLHWRLISYLTLGFLGIDSRGSRDGGAALREMLSLFADTSNPLVERQLQGIVSVASRPIARSIQRAGAFHAARGTEVTLHFDERAFEGSGVILIGAVLDRFLAEYASVNSFTQVVISSQQRGVLKTFAPRTGQGPLL